MWLPSHFNYWRVNNFKPVCSCLNIYLKFNALEHSSEVKKQTKGLKQVSLFEKEAQDVTITSWYNFVVNEICLEKVIQKEEKDRQLPLVSFIEIDINRGMIITFFDNSSLVSYIQMSLGIRSKCPEGLKCLFWQLPQDSIVL